MNARRVGSSMLFAARQLSESGVRETVLVVAGLMIAVAVGFYIVGKVRGAYRESDPGETNLLTNFREMHAQGELSDEEYRTIKAQLATRIRDQIRAEAEAAEKADSADA